MASKRRKQQEKPQPSSPLDEKMRALAEQQAKLREEMERKQRFIENAPELRKEQERQRREELVKRASRTDGRRGSSVALPDRRHFEFNAAMPARQKSLRAERRRGRFLFFVLLCTLAAVVYWAYLIFTRP